MRDQHSGSIFWARISVVLFILLMVSYCSDADAHEPCPDFTDEQRYLLDMAHIIGKSHDWGYTLAAITYQESFWGDEVRLSNVNDGDYGSYGPTHVQISTALWLLGWEDTEERRALVKYHLLNTPSFGMDLSLMLIMLYEDRGWHGMIMKHNGRGERAVRYADSVIERVRVLERCMLWE